MAPSIEDIRSFASEKILTTLDERYSGEIFSRDIWGEMGDMGALGMTVSSEYGGSGGTPRHLAEAVREFTRVGCDLGITLSWITHLALCVKSIEIFGTEEQKGRYLPRLVSGEWIGGAAVSEPKTGAHPGGIQTTAARTDSGFRLEGGKIYITDGPIADVLVVVAATGEDESGGKELSAFLVESSSHGFEAKRMDLNFLKTSPHGKLTFTGVELAVDAILGKPGEGHSSNSKTAFARERSLILSALSGLFEATAKLASDRLVERSGSLDLEGNESYSWIHHMSALEAYRRLSADLVEAAFNDPKDWLDAIDVLIYLGISFAKWSLWMNEFAAARKLTPAFPLDIVLNDMKLVMVGEGLLAKEGRKRYLSPNVDKV